MTDMSVLSHTESVCPDCLMPIPAQRVRIGDIVFLDKTCPRHGRFRTKIWQGNPAFESWVRPKVPGTIHMPFTEKDSGCPFDCGLCADHRQHTCTGIIEVTQRCNLHCTFCFADAGGKSIDPSKEIIRGWYQRLLDSGGPCNIQLSGGEPTLRNDLPELVEMGRSMGFSFIQVNTNGLRLSRDIPYLKALKAAGLASIFLQFDGTQPQIYQTLRGGNYLQQKLDTIDLCGELGIGVVLVPTVVQGVNDDNLGDILEFALQHMPAVRGVHFQPASYFGRIPETPSDDMRITLGEVMTKLEQQSGGRIKTDNLRPAGCENAMCSFHGNFILMENNHLLPTTKHQAGETCCLPTERAEEGASKSKQFVALHWAPIELNLSLPTASEHVAQGRADVAERCDDGCDRDDANGARDAGCDCDEGSGVVAAGCDCGAGEGDSMDRFLQRAQTHALTVSGMAFQDAWNLDLERLRDCCIHTVAPDGKLIPFCAYNLTDSRGHYFYRGNRQSQQPEPVESGSVNRG
ncbi:radical SAM (seleno)protein TrsS [Alicyclobacillus sp. SO9]|uniref:radical SAM (seleno)protein TrsS n=1 Tax=Alicyclobacillus sp. SO9 TaxID=2665646 RepID=UPI0018E6DC17|nr:radical SAM (seleno)protein TrsS [Alicyclobacillus sp. SO9]